MLKLGCLFILLAIGVAAWFTRDRWMPRVFGDRATASADLTAERWEPLSPASANRTRAALERLSADRGPVFETLTAADIAAYAFDIVADDNRRAVDSVMAGVFSDQVRVRAVLATSELSGLGAFAALLREREPVELAGTMRVVRPGLGELTVTEARVRDTRVPMAMVPVLLRQLLRGPRPEGVSENGIPVPLPDYIGDIRVANGRITLYRTTR